MNRGTQTKPASVLRVSSRAVGVEQADGLMRRSGPWWRRTAALALRHPYWTVGIAAASVRLVAVTVLGPLQPGVAVPDEIQYIELAESVAAGRGAEAWFPGYGQSLYDTTATYMRPLVALTWLFGEHQVLGQLLSAVFGVVAALLTTVLARQVLRAPFALIPGLMVALLPSQVYWSSVVLRESMTWAAAAGLALALARAKVAGRKRGALGWGVVAFTCLYALGDLRQLTAVLAAATLVIAAVLLPGPRRLAVTAGALVIGFVAPLLTGIGPFGYTFVESSVPRLAVIRANLSLGAASSLVDTTPVPDPMASSPATEPTSPDSVVVRTPSGEAFAVEQKEASGISNFPQGLVAVTLRPFPWEPAPNAGVLLAKLENVAWAVFYVLAAVGAAATWRRRTWTLLPIGFVVAVVSVAAITQGNLGTAFRHRGQVFWAIALLAAAGMQWAVDRRAARPS